MTASTCGDDEVQASDTANAALVSYLQPLQNTTGQQTMFGYSLMLYYGQSKCIGEQGFPALTTTPAYPDNVFMLGGSPRPEVLNGTDLNANLYRTFVDDNFHPLVCTNQDATGSTFVTFKAGALTANNVTVTMSQSSATFSWAGPPLATTVFAVGDTFQCTGFTVATGNNAIATSGQGNVFTITALPPPPSGGSIIVANGFLSAQPTSSPESGIVFAQVPTGVTLVFGEEAGVTQLNELYALQLGNSGTTQDTSTKWVMANGGVSGQTIAALSRDGGMGVPNNLYHRILQAATIFKTKASTLADSFGMPAILFNQGGSDEINNTPSDQYKASYKALVDDVTADIAVTIFSQGAPPFWFGTVVDGGAIETGLIAQAQMELFGCSPATGFTTPYTPNMYMIGGSYQMPDHGNHLSQNGYRWLGAMSAKIMNKVMFLGQALMPL